MFTAFASLDEDSPPEAPEDPDACEDEFLFRLRGDDPRASVARSSVIKYAVGLPAMVAPGKRDRWRH